MNTVNLILSVINKDQYHESIEFYHKYHSQIVYSTPCHGTTKHTLLKCLGLESKEMILLLTLSNFEDTKRILKGLIFERDLDHAGNGIAVIIPVQSISSLMLQQFDLIKDTALSSSSLPDDLYLSNNSTGANIPENGESMNESKFSLIIAIINHGFTDLVMDVAREQKASGGTIIHAKSTATEQVRKFFGISVVDEKEILLIVSKQETKSNIMKAIQERTGIHTQAGAVVFSVPVDSIAGIRFCHDV